MSEYKDSDHDVTSAESREDGRQTDAVLCSRGHRLPASTTKKV